MFTNSNAGDLACDVNSHRHLHALFLREDLCLIIARVHVANYPMPGSVVRTRSIRFAIMSVPSATVTCPACRE